MTSLFLAAVLSLPPQAPPVAIPAATAATECHRAAVQIDNGDKRFSGTVVHSGGGQSLVLTCWHGFRGGVGRLTVTHAGTVYAATFLGATDDPEADDAAVLLVRADLPAAAVADVDPPAGTPVRQWGLRGPKGGLFGRMFGRHVESTIPNESGDSGAGVFDPAGKLVAVNVAREAQPPFRALGVPLAVVRRLLGRLVPKVSAEPCEFPEAKANNFQSREGFKVAAGVPWTDYRTAAAGGKPVLILVSASWCVPCRRLKAELATLAPELAGWHVVELDADRDAAQVAALGGATAYPTLVVYDAGHRLKARTVGYQSADGLRAILR